MINFNKTIAKVFVYAFAIIPLFGLLWEKEIMGFKFNWIIYLMVSFSLLFITILKHKINRELLFTLLVFLLYAIWFVISNGDWQSISKILISLLPLFYLQQILLNQHGSLKNTALTIYILSIIVPVAIALLQLNEIVPYTDFDTKGGIYVGRMSGGYNKPNNFIAILFPLSLFALIILKKRRKLLAAIILIFIFFLIYKTGLRIAFAIYIIIFTSSFFPEVLIKFVYIYYKYFLNFFVGIISFIVILYIYHEFGIIDEIRGRFPVWEAHTVEFFNSKIINVFLGHGKVALIKEWDVEYVKNLDEVHNNSFRLIITFGVIGYLFYCLIIRRFVLKALMATKLLQHRFIIAACFFFIIFFSITTEPVFYPGIFWILLYPMFILKKK